VIWLKEGQGGVVNVVPAGGESSVVFASAEAPSARIRTGRLIEVRARRALTTLAAIKAFTADVVAAARQTAGQGLICADYRRASPLMPEMASPLAHSMRETNEHLLRSAVVVDPANTIFNLQIERVVHCAGPFEARRIFTDVAELRGWMSETATEAELQAIDAFLAPQEG
jgi:hypothetical protein